MSVTPDRVSGVALSNAGRGAAHYALQPGTALDATLDRLLHRLTVGIRDRPSEQGSEAISIVFDVSEVLAPRSDELPVLVRIAPRPPAEPGHEAHPASHLRAIPRILHITGGHTTLGEELVGLDEPALRRTAGSLPKGGRYIVTSVGSLVNPAHELRAGEILLDIAEPTNIEHSRNFVSSSFAIREQSAFVNDSLLPAAETFASAIARAVARLGPQARAYVATNDGGCTPLTRLSITPVHAALSAASSELLGAATVCGIESGHVIVAGPTRRILGELVSGAPTTLPKRRIDSGHTLATHAANVNPVTESLLADREQLPLLVPAAPGTDLGDYPSDRVRSTEVDLRALGAANAPLSEWVDRVVKVSNEAEMERALAAARARVGARLVSFGAQPPQVRILESSAVATAYEHPSVVSVRVRGTAGIRPGGDAERSGHATQQR